MMLRSRMVSREATIVLERSGMVDLSTGRSGSKTPFMTQLKRKSACFWMGSLARFSAYDQGTAYVTHKT